VKILMVCLGNICRSPTAEGVLRARLAQEGVDGVEVDSAGTADYHTGEPPDERTVAHARRRGYDLSVLRARQVKPIDFVLFDRVYAMDTNNLANLRRACPPEHAHKLALFLDVLGEPGRPVPDPWSGGPRDFELVLDLCEAACARIVAELRARRALA
jgi:protein-tyrosine phosphatase